MKNISSAFVVIVGVILAVDVAIRLAPQEAMAQTQPSRHLVAISDKGKYRAWSDGTVESYFLDLAHPSKGGFGIWLTLELQSKTHYPPWVRNDDRKCIFHPGMP